jgi:hypothetical protein
MSRPIDYFRYADYPFTNLTEHKIKYTYTMGACTFP